MKFTRGRPTATSDPQLPFIALAIHRYAGRVADIRAGAGNGAR